MQPADPQMDEAGPLDRVEVPLHREAGGGEARERLELGADLHGGRRGVQHLAVRVSHPHRVRVDPQPTFVLGGSERAFGQDLVQCEQGVDRDRLLGLALHEPPGSCWPPSARRGCGACARRATSPSPRGAWSPRPRAGSTGPPPRARRRARSPPTAAAAPTGRAGASARATTPRGWALRAAAAGGAGRPSAGTGRRGRRGEGQERGIAQVVEEAARRRRALRHSHL